MRLTTSSRRTVLAASLSLLVALGACGGGDDTATSVNLQAAMQRTKAGPRNISGWNGTASDGTRLGITGYSWLDVSPTADTTLGSLAARTYTVKHTDTLSDANHTVNVYSDTLYIDAATGTLLAVAHNDSTGTMTAFEVYETYALPTGARPGDHGTVTTTHLYTSTTSPDPTGYRTMTYAVAAHSDPKYLDVTYVTRQYDSTGTLEAIETRIDTVDHDGNIIYNSFERATVNGAGQTTSDVRWEPQLSAI